MVTQRQRRDIERLMRRIKDAKTPPDENQPPNTALIEKRTKELYNYLEKEGLVNQFDE